MTYTKSHIRATDSTAIPLVTVIVPVYNAELYLEECLDSIAAQTHTSLEVIMVNDGSNDSSADICRRFADRDRRFRLLDLPNRGVSAARNTGIDQARGSYISFIDADDIMHPDLIRRLTATAADTGADIVIAAHRFGYEPSFSDRGSRPEIFTPEQIAELGLYKRRKVTAVWAGIMHRDIFAGGLRFREGIRFEDLDIFYRILLAGKRIALIPDRLYFYRKNDASFLNTFSEGRFDALDVTDRMLGYMNGRSPRLRRAARDRRFGAHFNALLLLLEYNLHRPEIMKRCIGVIRAERWSEILNPKVKLKNRLGAIASFGGMRFLRFLNRLL